MTNANAINKDYEVRISKELDADWGSDYPHRVDVVFLCRGHVDEELSRTLWFTDPAKAHACEQHAKKMLAKAQRELPLRRALSDAMRFLVVAAATLTAVAFLFSLGG